MAADRPELNRISASATKLMLDELIALTDEMAALIRAGVPLETGLAQASADLSRRPGKVADDLARRLQAGETFPHALADSSATFSPIYIAVVEAGLQCGRLPAALEGLAKCSRRIADLRRMARVAMLYPAIVAFFAFGLFVAAIVWFQPRLTQAYEAMDLPPSPLNLRLAELGRSAPMWAPWIPIAALLALLFWWAWSKRATTSSPRWWSFSSSRRLLYYSQLTTFADLLALLIEHGTPLGQAVVLAADAGGDKRLKKSAHEFAQFVAAGIKTNQPAAEGHPQRLNDVKETAPALAGFPPLVNWLLIAGGSQATLVDSLRNVARAYQHRVERLDDWLRLYLPLSLIVVVGGSGVVIYAISLLGPWYQMLTHLGDSLR